MALETELAHLVWDNPDLSEQVFILYPSRPMSARCASGLADRLDGPPTWRVLPYEDAIASWVGGEMRYFSPVPRQEPTHPRPRRIEGRIEVIDHYWCLWVDLDGPHGLESVEARLRHLDFWPSAIVGSGNRGFHLYFRLALSVPIALIELYNRALAELVGGDVTSPAMPNTALRVPGTVNETSGRTAELVEMSGAAYGANALHRLNAGLLPALEPMMQKLQRRRQAAERRVAAAERRRQKVEQREERVFEIRQELDRRGERISEIRQQLDRKRAAVERREEHVDRRARALDDQRGALERWKGNIRARLQRLRRSLSRTARTLFPTRPDS
jgi:hypothetical protein